MWITSKTQHGVINKPSNDKLRAKKRTTRSNGDERKKKREKGKPRFGKRFSNHAFAPFLPSSLNGAAS
jgi:hypothetical protein